MKNFAQAFVAVLETRNAAVPSKDTVTAINNAKRHDKALDLLFGSKVFAPIAKRLLTAVAIADKAQDKDSFIAVKVLVKIVSASVALATNNTGAFDPYSRTLIQNLIHAQKLGNKDALVSLSKAIVYTETDQQQSLIAHYECSANTATTQASSTRMMLRALDICAVGKGVRNDSMVLHDNKRAAALVALFGEEVETSETDDDTGEEEAA